MHERRTFLVFSSLLLFHSSPLFFCSSPGILFQNLLIYYSFSRGKTRNSYSTLTKRSLIHPFKLPGNHILKNLLSNSPPQNKSSTHHNIGSLTHRQQSLTKGHIIDSSIKSYGIFPSFSPLDSEFSPGH